MILGAVSAYPRVKHYEVSRGGAAPVARARLPRSLKGKMKGSDDLDHILVDGQHVAAPRDILDQQFRHDLVAERVA